jgi:hypothetical protein
MEMNVAEPLIRFLESCDIESNNKLYRKMIEAIYMMLAVYFWNNDKCKSKWVNCYRMLIRHAEFSTGALIALR